MLDLPWPAIALLAGLVWALAGGRPLPKGAKALSRLLLQGSVVLLGFSMDLGLVARAGMEGLGFALVSITGVFLLGWGLQRALRIRPVAGLLVSAGTAICGGSAIAAMAATVDAEDEDVAVASGTVFLLNAAALFLFPPLGRAIGLDGHQFGVWSGIAIHDVASVVGAGAIYGDGALEVATAVKLSRVLYLVPVLLIASWWLRRARQGPAPIPWFIGLFVVAGLSRSWLPAMAGFSAPIQAAAKIGLSASLFLIGAGITRSALRSVGARPLVQGVLLWIAIGLGALAMVLAG